MTWLRLADGSTWPPPDISNGDAESLGWRLRYQPDTITRTEKLAMAEYISAYNYLFEPTMTARAMGEKVAMLRRVFRERTSHDAAPKEEA